MKIENIHDSWGSKIYLESPQEFFNYTPDYWRKLMYKRKILFFKEVNFTKAEYAKFSYYFGKPWTQEAYRYSYENVEPIETMTISPISDESKRLGRSSMPWHADIPNRRFKPFPFRSLWIVSNPNPAHSGKTSWLNLEEAVDYLTPEMKELLPRIRIVQQSWYIPGTDIQEFDMLKIHPITGNQSLRLNYFNEGARKNAWISNVKIDGITQPDCSLIKDWLAYFEKIPELIYQHVWDTKDIGIYDNWSFVHARTLLILGNNETRKFYRINIDHLNEQEWSDHKKGQFDASNPA